MFEGPLQDLIDELSASRRGPEKAQRIAFHLLTVEPEDIDRLQRHWRSPRRCDLLPHLQQHFPRRRVCRICADSSRDRATARVVEEPKDIQVIERTAEYPGRYHVLGGSLDPLANVGPKDLNITTLLQRIGGVVQDSSWLDSTPEAPLTTTPSPSPKSSSQRTPTPKARPRRRTWCDRCATSRT